MMIDERHDRGPISYKNMIHKFYRFVRNLGRNTNVPMQ